MTRLFLLALLLLPVAASAQTQPKPSAKKALQVVRPRAEAPEKLAEPATPETAARVLDLRTFAVMEGAKVSGHRSLARLAYEAQATTEAAFEFVRRELARRGFKELPGAYISKQTCTGHFTKDGFVVAASSSEIGDAAKAGRSSVSLINHGNAPLDKLPVPAGVKPFYPTAGQASYTTDARVAETAAACRKLLLAAGWEPYGQAGGSDAESSIQYFKRNAIKLQSWVSKTPAEGGKTLIRYDAELLSADLPAPPGTADPRYDDTHKKLDFDSPPDQADAIFAFYQERMPKLGWQATTERPVRDDRKKTQFLVFRNPQKDLLSLDLQHLEGIVRVRLQHQTEAEFAEVERLATEQAERARLAEEKRNMKIKVAVPLPAKAGNLEKSEANLFEFTLATGGGPAALQAFRTHFRKEGWTEEKGAEFGKNAGDLDFQKGESRLSFSYFDIGLGDVEIRVSASKNIVLEPVTSGDKPPAEAPAAKAKAPAVPGLPALPPGVEIPADVEALLKKALEDAGVKSPKVGPKKGP
jgi:hypothetical protein